MKVVLTIDRLILGPSHQNTLLEIAFIYGAELRDLGDEAKKVFRDRCFSDGERPPNDRLWPAYEAIMGDEATSEEDLGILSAKDVADDNVLNRDDDCYSDCIP